MKYKVKIEQVEKMGFEITFPVYYIVVRRGNRTHFRSKSFLTSKGATKAWKNFYRAIVNHDYVIC